MIKITCKGADSLPLDVIEDFQGGLKKRSKDDIDKIIKSIELYGFSFPFFVWNGSGHNYCLDGHGRIQALSQMRQRGEDLPLFPVVYVEAENEEEAKNKLLRLNSQYGQMTVNSVLEFAGDISVDWQDLSIPDSKIEFGYFDVGESTAPELAEGDREPFQQMTFTMSDMQAETVKEAIKKAKEDGGGASDENSNSNGNALAWVAGAYLGGC